MRTTNKDQNLKKAIDQIGLVAFELEVAINYLRKADVTNYANILEEWSNTLQEDLEKFEEV